jgi:hypothetical protein
MDPLKQKIRKGMHGFFFSFSISLQTVDQQTHALADHPLTSLKKKKNKKGER